MPVGDVQGELRAAGRRALTAARRRQAYPVRATRREDAHRPAGANRADAKSDRVVAAAARALRRLLTKHATKHANTKPEPKRSRDEPGHPRRQVEGDEGARKEQWGKITDDELDRAEGKAEQLVGLLQQRYGYSKEKAQEEYDRFLRNSETEARR